MIRLLCLARGLSRRPGKPHHDKALHNKSKEARQHSFPMTVCDNIESGQNDTHSQQQAAEEQTRGLVGRKPFLNRPPKAAEEYDAEQNANYKSRCQGYKIIGSSSFSGKSVADS